MNTYFIWIAIVLFIFLAYSTFVLKKTRKHSKFQARLSVYFFLFMLIPVVPLLILFSTILINSTNLIAPPDIDKALNQSLEILRQNLDQRGNTFFQTVTDYSGIDTRILDQHQMDYSSIYKSTDQYKHAAFFISTISEINQPPEQLSRSAIITCKTESVFSRIVPFEEHNYFEYYQLLSDSSIACIAYKIDPKMFTSIIQINQLLKNYTSFSLFRDSIVENHLIWFITLGIMIILAFISFQLAKAVSKELGTPILQLAEGMKRIGSGDLNYRVNVKAKDEIEFLINSFNNMTGELQISRENLKKAERAAAWRDVARQISHEIKNPLTPIELSLYRMKNSIPEGSEGYPDIIASVRIIEEEIASMRRLASSFSEFAKMPQLQLKNENIDLIIKDCIALYKEYPLHYHPSKVPAIQIDKEQIRRAVNNLIKNAIEASPNNTPIKIELYPSPNSEYTLCIKITDQGEGIDKQLLKKILKPYYTTKKEGSGLGLFIVNRIINEHAGNLSISSQKGHGTTITIEL